MLRRISIFLGGLVTGLLASGLLLLLIRSRPRHPIELIPPPTPGPIQVHVAGAVQSPGVVQVDPGSIVEQAIAAAGGPSEDADLIRLNLAEPLRDGQQVYIPSFQTADPPAQASPLTDSYPSELVNINTANEVQLEVLPGIGPSLAKNIVDYRQEHGWFQEFEELLQVTGIGPAKLEQIRDLIIFR